MARSSKPKLPSESVESKSPRRRVAIITVQTLQQNLEELKKAAELMEVGIKQCRQKKISELRIDGETKFERGMKLINEWIKESRGQIAIQLVSREIE